MKDREPIVPCFFFVQELQRGRLEPPSLLKYFSIQYILSDQINKEKLNEKNYDYCCNIRRPSDW